MATDREAKELEKEFGAALAHMFGRWHIVKCLRCGHEWPTKANHPRVCPHCQSAWWDRPRREKKK